MKNKHGITPFRRGKCDLWWVISREVDFLPFPKGMIENGQRDRVWVRNYLVSTRDGIWQLSKFVSVEGPSIRATDIVLQKAREICVYWW